MMILGKNSLNTSYLLTSSTSPFNKLTIKNAVYDNLALYNSSDRSYTTSVDTDMQSDTVLLIGFNGDISNGGISFSISNTNCLILKRREVGDLTWQILRKIDSDEFNLDEVNNIINFTIVDRYARSNTEYEYLITPVVNGAETRATSEFIVNKVDGISITDGIDTYYSFIECEVTEQENAENIVVPTVGRKYPYGFTIGESDYLSGTAKGVFCEFNKETCTFNFEDSWRYRKKFRNFLLNGRAKVLKHWDGRMWLIAVGTTVTDDASDYYKKVVTSFDWTEIGDVDDFDTLESCDLRIEVVD